MTLPRTIIFDLSEVFIAGLVGVEHALAARCSVAADTVLSHFWGDHLWQLCRGRMSEAEYLDRSCGTAKWKVPRAELRQIIRKNFERRIDDMEPILDALRQRYELVLLSDHAREWVEHIRTLHPFLEYFSRRFFSFEIGAIKAEAASFQHVLEQLGRTPAECLFIDDSAANIAVATSLGIPSIRFTDAAALRTALKARGVLT